MRGGRFMTRHNIITTGHNIMGEVVLYEDVMLHWAVVLLQLKVIIVWAALKVIFCYIWHAIWSIVRLLS